MSKSKSIRWPLVLSLPFVVAGIWFALVVFARFEHSRLVAQLTAQVGEGSPDAAREAVRQMARMVDPPWDALVAAANSDNEHVAAEARSSIDALLDHWQQQVEGGQPSPSTAANLAALAAALDSQREDFSQRDHSWLTATARKIVRLANKASIEDARDIAMHCESLLTQAAVPRASSADRAQSQSNAASQAAQRPVNLPATSPRLAPRPGPSEAENVFSSPPQSALRSIAADDGSHGTGGFQQKNATRTPNRFDSNWNPRWARPGADDTADSPRLGSPSGTDASPDDSTSELTKESASANKESKPTSAWEKHDSRELLASWLTAKGNGKLSLEHELARRGLTPLSKDLVRPLLSESVADRIQLVHGVMDAAGVDAKPWLALLADDMDAEVRLEAVNVMATSKDPELIEKAWQVALHDHDPRIASLAERLRDRHSGIQRR